ncbi:MAG: response regulator [Treponema sp.]|jgi:signal transduction histidine kinase/ActR/RegA family two-component response regulator|nr:response regulator [Treponema sp.]
MHQKYLRLMLENSPDIILLLDQDSRLIYCSAVFLELARIRRFRSIHKQPLDKVYSVFGDKNFVEQGIRQFELLKSFYRTITYKAEIDFSGAGNRRTYTIKNTPVLDDAGNFDGALILYHDITELLCRERAERIRIMFDASPLACMFWDPEGKLIDCNQEALNLFEVSSKEAFIKGFYNFSPRYQSNGKLTRLKIQEDIQEAYRAGRKRFEWLHCTSKGERLPTEVTLVRVEWRDGYRVVGYTRDVRYVETIEAIEAKRQEADVRNQELEVQTRAAQVASETKSRFLAAMSHEIRTPMNTIIGMSDMMRIDNLDETQRSFLGDIKKMSKALLQIINDILDISKIEAGKLELTPIHFNLLELYNNICSLSRFSAEAKELEWRQSFDPAVPHIIYGDDLRIRQVITNIVNNAIKYTKTGYVDFRVKRIIKQDQEYLAFIVHDTGIGIKKEHFSKIFNRFQKLEDKFSHGIMGTGLGLPITKNMLAIMHGFIEFESEYGVGSTFSIFLPLIEGDPAQIEGPSPSSCVIAAEDTRLLVVDDDEINLRVALSFLRNHRINADIADNGAAAIRMVQEKPYDLVFMDQMMPEMNGIEATRRIRGLEGKRFKTMPIIALSANVISGARERFLAAGMNDFIPKPIEAQDLNRKLAKWLPQEKIVLIEGHFKHIERDQGFYRRLLASFRSDHGNDVQRITEALQQGDRDLAYRLTHALKGVLGLFDSGNAKTIVKGLEKALTTGNTVQAELELPRLGIEINRLLQKATEGIPEMPNKIPQNTTLDPRVLRDILETLEPLLAARNTASLTFVRDLQNYGSDLNGGKAILIKQIEDFEFSNALATLRTIKEHEFNGSGFKNDSNRIILELIEVKAPLDQG